MVLFASIIPLFSGMWWIISLNLPSNWILRWNSFCSAPISAVAWSLSGEYVVSVDKSRRAVLWSDIWDQTWAPFFHLINWNHSWKCTQGCHQNTTLLGKAHTLHSVNSKTFSVVTVFVAKKPCHSKAQTDVLMLQGSGDCRAELSGFLFWNLVTNELLTQDVVKHL